MKKGFTLIELMVVIVIMGVLSAVAVPKIFSLVAKAKVSEIQSAAGSYIHLQEAYLAGSPTFGNWSAIGYTAPGDGNSNNFCYSQGTITSSAEIETNDNGTIGWGASNKSKLNSCATNSWWSISISGKDKPNIAYNQYVSSSECQVLLSRWSVGTTLSGNCN
ncbi:MAG: type II secretion system protein [Fibrobacter sp.]|nr:type II secretion system protein [Fibrobacter sp.]